VDAEAGLEEAKRRGVVEHLRDTIPARENSETTIIGTRNARPIALPGAHRAVSGYARGRDAAPAAELGASATEAVHAVPPQRAAVTGRCAATRSRRPSSEPTP
jgi:hypothetical protein